MRRLALIAALTLFAGCTAPAKPQEPETRAELTWSVLQELNRTDDITKLCDIEVYEAPATTTAAFRSDKYGVEMQLPHNPKWGTRTHALSVAHEPDNENAILFGPLGHGELCSLIRYWEMKILPPRSADEAEAGIRRFLIEGSALTEPPTLLAPKRTTIGEHTVIEYMDIGLCTYPTIEVIGKTYNYKLAYCAAAEDREQSLEPLREIVETMRFL